MVTKPRVLIVDDDAALRQLVRVTLSPDFELDDAADGAEALSRVASHPYDAVVLDVMMPGLDGYSVCRAIRVLPGGDTVKIVFLTGRGGVAGRVEGRSAGADAYLTKPFSPQHLRAELLRLLGTP